MQNDGIRENEYGWLDIERRKKLVRNVKQEKKLMREKWNDNNNNNNEKNNDTQTSISNDIEHGFTKSNTFFAFILWFFLSYELLTGTTIVWDFYAFFPNEKKFQPIYCQLGEWEGDRAGKNVQEFCF